MNIFFKGIFMQKNILFFLSIIIFSILLFFSYVIAEENTIISVGNVENDEYSIKLPWSTKTNQLSLVTCINYAPDVTTQIKVTLYGVEKEKLLTSYNISKNSERSFFVSEMKGFSNIKSETGTIGVTSKSKNIYCYMNYYSYDDEDEIIETSNLEKNDIVSGSSYLIYNPNIYKKLKIKSSKLYVYNLSDSKMDFMIKGYNHIGKNTENYKINELVSNGEKVIDLKKKKIRTFFIDPISKNKEYFAFIEIEFTNGEKERLKIQKSFTKSNTLNATGTLVLSNISKNKSKVIYEIYSGSALNKSNEILLEPFSQQIISIKENIKSIKNPIIKIINKPQKENTNCNEYTCEVSSDLNGIIAFIKGNNVINRFDEKQNLSGTDTLIPYNFSLGESGVLNIFNEGTDDTVVNVSFSSKKLLTLTIKKHSNVSINVNKFLDKSISGFLYVSSTKKFITSSLITTYQKKHKKDSRGLIISSNVSIF